jgi:hypothetical protein
VLRSINPPEAFHDGPERPHSELASDISNVAIIFGLGLVAYELNQSKQLALGQMAESCASRMTDRHLAILGENPQEALAKAAFHPADLNEEDAATLDAFYEHIVIGWGAAHPTSQVVGADRGWRDTVRFEAPRFFSSQPGRRWLKAWAARLGDTWDLNEVAKLAQEAVRDGSGNSFRSNYETLLAKD